MSLSPQLATTLKAIYDGTVANGVHYGNPGHPMIAALVKSGHVETDTNRADPNDGRRVAVQLTATGHEANGTTPTTQTQEPAMNTPAAATSTTTEIKVRRTRTTVVPEVRLGGFMAMPAAAARRGGNRTETYAFGKLEAPRPDGTMHSFFVPATVENPRPVETLRAATSSATARYKDKGGAVFKHFVVDNDAEFGVAGVRVFRVK